MDRQSSGRIGMYLLLAALLIVGYLFLNQQVNTRSDYSYEQMVADLKEGKIMERIMAILSLIVPLFVSAFQRAEDLANAMEARGYSPGEERTRYKVLKMEGRDYVLLAGAAALLACMVWLAYFR